MIENLKKKDRGAAKRSPLTQLARPAGAPPKGFTMVEMLIVLFIIAVLSTLAINGYTEYRRTALLDFAADSFAAQFYGLRDGTVHGDFGSTGFDEISESIALVEAGEEPVYASEEDIANCFGYYLNVEGDVSIQKFEISYSNKQEFDPVREIWFREGCDYDELRDPTLTATVFSDLGLDEEVGVVGIYDENGINLGQNIAIAFIPPNGEIYIYPENEAPEVVKIEMKYGKSEEDKYKRNIFIDLTSGQVTVTRNDYVEAEA